MKDILIPLAILFAWLFVTDTMYCIERRRNYLEAEGWKFINSVSTTGYGYCRFLGYSDISREAKFLLGVNEVRYLQPWDSK